MSTTHPALNLDAHPDAQIHSDLERMPDEVALADTVETADLGLARAHAATNIEFLFVSLPASASVRIVGYDAARKRITIASGATYTVYLSRTPVDHLFNNGNITPIPTVANIIKLSAFNSNVDIDGPEPVYAYAGNSGYSISALVERYANIQ